jgi:hypothetical protein
VATGARDGGATVPNTDLVDLGPRIGSAVEIENDINRIARRWGID